MGSEDQTWNNLTLTYVMILEEDLMQLRVYKVNPKCILLDSYLETGDHSIFSTNRGLQVNPQQTQLGDVVPYYPL
ncbi:hypothetical protein TNCV_2457941 [Trichonephila clavipes]|nr:hypothetical protein TNCV_2457941 [Trichonephila clavipes]